MGCHHPIYTPFGTPPTISLYAIAAIPLLRSHLEPNDEKLVSLTS